MARGTEPSTASWLRRGAAPRLPKLSDGGSRRYHGGVAAQLVRTFREMAEAFEHAPPPTDDDVCITLDGRRLDSPEKVRAFLDELNASVAAERAAAKG
jgi:hypothetical protein